jgi:hypothetical protein
MLAHPANLFGGYTNHQCVGLHIPIDQRTSTHKSKFTYCGSANDVQLAPKVAPFLTRVLRYSLLRSMWERGL